MRDIRIGIVIAVLFRGAAQAQEILPPAISSVYDATLSAMQSSKSRQDIIRMVETMDSSDWVGLAPTGEKMSRSQAETQLLGLLTVPAGKRPIPQQKLVYVSDSGSRALVVYWVYRTTEAGSVGSMVRDSWIKTQAGWRRSMHEKLFPDRLLKLP